MTPWLRRALGLGMAALLTVAPFVYYRAAYTHAKRVREVTPGVFYRCGQLTEAGFREVVGRYHIRTIVNAQDEYPDPDIARGYFDRRTMKETELCKQLGVRYVYLPPALLPHRLIPEQRPATIDEFLALMDDPKNHPVLVHCKAGLHRTGVLAAVYRMEYEGFSPSEALEDLKDNGFSLFAATSANDYITQYILTYRRGQRNEPNAERGARNAESEVGASSAPHSAFRVPHSLDGGCP